MVGAHHIQHAGLGLHHVGAAAAGVGDGVVDPCLIAHVLPQELHADVHQLHSVQGTAAPVGSAGGVGRHAGEVVLRLDTGVGGAGLDFVGVLRVPGDGGIQLLPKAVPGHEGLGGAALLTGAAVEDHGAGSVGGFQERLDPQGRSHGAGTQEIVSAAVAAAAGDPLLPFHAASLLGQAGERIVLRQDADDGASGAVAGGKGRGDVADPLLHGEALFFQDLTIKGGGPGLLQRELRVVPDAVRHLGDEVALGLHGGHGRLLFLGHSHNSFPEKRAARSLRAACCLSECQRTLLRKS